jgi:hypothetical protein
MKPQQVHIPQVQHQALRLSRDPLVVQRAKGGRRTGVHERCRRLPRGLSHHRPRTGEIPRQILRCCRERQQVVAGRDGASQVVEPEDPVAHVRRGSPMVKASHRDPVEAAGLLECSQRGADGVEVEVLERDHYRVGGASSSLTMRTPSPRPG